MALTSSLPFSLPFLLLMLLLYGGVVLGDLTITTPQGLIDFSNKVDSGNTYSGTTVYLGADLVFTSALSSSFVPIGKNSTHHFKGTFDGQGHIINNLTLTSSLQQVALFGYSVGATIKNVVFDEPYSVLCTCSDYDIVDIGSVGGYCQGCIIEGIVNMGSIMYAGSKTNLLYLGGFVGRLNYPSTIRNCVNYGYLIQSGTVTSAVHGIGGILGVCASYGPRYLHNCANYGAIIFNGTSPTSTLKMGGILGVSYDGNTFIDNCVSAGKIESEIQATNNYIGSVLGYVRVNSATIAHCYWTSDVRYNTVYGYKESSSSVTTTSDNSLVELSITTMNDLNTYAEKNSTWDKWFMLHLNEGTINNISQETIIVTQKYFPDPVKEGSSFLFWCIDTECIEKYNPKTTDITGITDLYVMWDLNITVIFDFGNGTRTTKNVTCGEKYGDLPEAGEKEGYTFAGWFTEEDGNGMKIVKDTKVEIDDDHTLYAHWTINNYTLTFIFNNSESDEVRILNYSEVIEYPEDTKRKGYTFNRWLNYTVSMPAHNLIVTAQWTPNNYTVTFNATGGYVSEYEKNVTYDDAYGELPKAEKEGYSFAGWFTEEDGKGVEITKEIKVEIDDDHTLYAHWTINNYTLTFIFNNGKSDEVRILNYSDPIIIYPDDPVSEGYTFNGWDNKGITTMPAHNLIITSLWTINNYTLTFIFNNGKSDEVRILNYSNVINYPNDPVKEGYTFNGWGNKDITTMPAHNLIITAHWTINNYTLTFVFDNGKSDEVRILNYNETIEYPEDPVREGFTFNGWSSKPKAIPAHSTTITAQWIEKPSEFVEIVFGKKDLSEEEVKAIISTYTEEEFVIEKFEVDEVTGEIRVIIRFVDSSEAAAEFVRNVNENTGSENFIREIGVKEDYDSLTTILHPTMFSSLFIF